MKKALYISFAILLIGSLYFNIRLNNQNKAIRLDLSNEKALRQHYIHEDRYNALKSDLDSMSNVIDSWTPDTIIINKIRIKYDTITERIIDSNYYYQLQWYKSEINRLYPD